MCLLKKFCTLKFIEILKVRLNDNYFFTNETFGTFYNFPFMLQTNCHAGNPLDILQAYLRLYLHLDCISIKLCLTFIDLG